MSNPLNHTQENPIDLSVIVPVFNVENYLKTCIDSLLNQDNIRIEIILIDDGSTDSSGVIADQYARQDSRIKVIHQENKGPSAARNAGLSVCEGVFIAFVDSDDQIRENALCELVRVATDFEADLIMGNYQSFNPRGEKITLFKPIPEGLTNTLLCGKDCFVRMMQTDSFPPIVWSNIYRNAYIRQLQLRFEEGVIFEDVLWTILSMCNTSNIVITDIDYYYYHQRKGSLTQTKNIKRRLTSAMHIANRLMEFADQFDFLGEDSEFKNWLYVQLFELYAAAFICLPDIKDSSFKLPDNYLERFRQDCREMNPWPQEKCREHYRRAQTRLRYYADWMTSDLVASIAYRMDMGKKLMLIYNPMPYENYLQVKEYPGDWVVTADRRYFRQADAVVFYLPQLYYEIDSDIEKPEEQIWLARYAELDKNHPKIEDMEIRETFDFWTCYQSHETQQYTTICRMVDEKLFETDKVLCPCCGKTYGRFIHFDYKKPYEYDYERYQEATVKNIACPDCFSFPRHRIACHYFDNIRMEGDILLFGAEISIKSYFDRKGLAYTTADLFEGKADLKIDIQDTQTPDEQWDLIICNHVLEHVADYKKALSEIRRILKRDGLLEITVPINRNCETVYEDPAMKTPAERIKAYGQSDHLRIFGNDFKEILKTAGFAVEIVDGNHLPTEIGCKIGPADYDDNKVFICKKNDGFID